MHTTRRLLAMLNIAAMLCWVTLAIVVYDKLPAEIPTHFGPSGAADAFAAKSVSSWFALTAIGVCTTVMMLGLAEMAHRNPGLYNVPGKMEMLSLPPAQQRPFLEQLALFMTVTATSVLWLFIAIHYDMWRVAMEKQTSLSAVSWSAMIVVIGGTLIATPVWMWRFKRAVVATHASLMTPSARRAS